MHNQKYIGIVVVVVVVVVGRRVRCSPQWTHVDNAVAIRRSARPAAAAMDAVRIVRLPNSSDPPRRRRRASSTSLLLRATTPMPTMNYPRRRDNVPCRSHYRDRQ